MLGNVLGTSYRVATPSPIAAVIVSAQCPPARVSGPLVLCPHTDDCMPWTLLWDSRLSGIHKLTWVP